MERTREHETDRRNATERIEYYMPGTLWPSAETSRIERFVKSLFRRRGGLRPARNEDQ
jgi:hypothetical protein